MTMQKLSMKMAVLYLENCSMNIYMTIKRIDQVETSGYLITKPISSVMSMNFYEKY